MNILTVDTSSNSACLGLFSKTDDASVSTLFEREWNKKRSHSEVITSVFQQGLLETQLQPQEIHLICLGIGPGSFTGIRVALNFAKAISYSYNIPIYTVNSLKPIALQNSKQANHIIVLNNAFRNMVYGLSVDLAEANMAKAPFACSPVDILNFIDSNFLNKNPLLIGDAVELYKSLFPINFLNSCRNTGTVKVSKSPKALVDCYLQDKSPETRNWNEVVPLYIRGSEAEEKLKLKNNQ